MVPRVKRDFQRERKEGVGLAGRRVAVRAGSPAQCDGAEVFCPGTCTRSVLTAVVKAFEMLSKRFWRLNELVEAQVLFPPDGHVMLYFR